MIYFLIGPKIQRTDIKQMFRNEILFGSLKLPMHVRRYSLIKRRAELAVFRKYIPLLATERLILV